MFDLRKDPKFYYSQASLSAFIKCPKKFRLKYLEGLNWKSEDGHEDDFFKTGREFHLLAERYFSGIIVDTEKLTDEAQRVWFERLKHSFPLEKGKLYLTEYEIRMNDNGRRVVGKYDLIVLDETGNIEIYDWKTEPVKLRYEKLKEKLQTKVYMVLAAKYFGIVHKEEYEKVSMTYWQPEYYDEKIEISYSEERYQADEEQLIRLIDKINGYPFDNNDIGEKHCAVCEFVSVCGAKSEDIISTTDDIGDFSWDNIETIKL